MSEDEHLIRENLSLKNALSGFKSSRKKWKGVLLDLVVSTRPLQHLVRIHGPLLFFGPSSFVCLATRRLRSSFALALPTRLTQVLPPTQILPLPPPSPPPQSSLKEDPDVTGSPTRSIPLDGWTGDLPRARGHWHVCCCVEGACEEVDWGWDVELVGQEEQEVVLINLELAAWMVNFGPLGDTFPGL